MTLEESLINAVSLLGLSASLFFLAKFVQSLGVTFARIWSVYKLHDKIETIETRIWKTNQSITSIQEELMSINKELNKIDPELRLMEC